MERKGLLKGFSQSGQSEALSEPESIRIVREDEKIPIEIREVMRIRPQDFQAFKSSFEDWVSQWD
jgi:hypothetical protein